MNANELNMEFHRRKYIYEHTYNKNRKCCSFYFPSEKAKMCTINCYDNKSYIEFVNGFMYLDLKPYERTEDKATMFFMLDSLHNMLKSIGRIV